MDYPELAKLEDLETTHSHYDILAPIYRKIDDLARGGHAIEAKKSLYVVRRPTEDEELYKLRLAKFAYTNVMGAAIRQQATKLETGTVNFSGIPQRHDKFFSKFRESTDGSGRSERELLSLIFRKSVQFGAIYALVEKPYTEVKPKNSLQEEQLGASPYVVTFTPVEVINWSQGRAGLEWIKVRQIDQVTSQLGKTIDRATWTIIDSKSIVKYQHLVKLNGEGKVEGLLDSNGEDINPFPGPITIPRVRLVEHGRGEIPVVKLQLPDDLWSCNQAYLKASEHLNVENAWIDTAVMAGYVQRVFTPTDPKPDSDIHQTFEDDSPEDIVSDNAHVLIGKGFAFSEVQGSSLQTISESVLDKLERQIRDIICINGASATKDALQQSGVSKSMDFTNEESTLQAYGRIICDFYQDVLQQVAIALGMKPGERETLSVTGLDSFSLDTLESTLENAKELQGIEPLIAPTALKLFYIKLQGLMNKNQSAEQKALIEAETEKIWANRFAFPSNGTNSNTNLEEE